MSCPLMHQRTAPDRTASGLFALAYGGVAYAMFAASFLWLIAFTLNLAGPFSVDRPVAVDWATALAIDVALLGVFAMQHTVMARTAFKRRWTRIVPAQLERSTYVILSALLVAALVWLWQPLPGSLWHVTSDAGRMALFAVAVSGWLLVAVTSFQIDHWHLLGLRQVWSSWRGRPLEDPGFATPVLYRLVRHPMMIGYFLGFWATPDMTVSHLVLALGMTVYILVAIPFEEADLERGLGAPYRAYRAEVPRLMPRLIRRPGLPSTR